MELNPTRDLLQSLAAKIYSIPELHTLFINAKLDFSAFGLGVSIENAAPVTDIENALELMLKYIQKSEKRLLISVDEDEFRIYPNLCKLLSDFFTKRLSHLFTDGGII